MLFTKVVPDSDKSIRKWNILHIWFNKNSSLSVSDYCLVNIWSVIKSDESGVILQRQNPIYSAHCNIFNWPTAAQISSVDGALDWTDSTISGVVHLSLLTQEYYEHELTRGNLNISATYQKKMADVSQMISNRNMIVQAISKPVQPGAYCKSWIVDPKMVSVQTVRIACLPHTPKSFLASRLLQEVCNPLNMHSSVNPIMPLAQPGYVNLPGEDASSNNWVCLQQEVSCQQFYRLFYSGGLRGKHSFGFRRRFLLQ